jgi:DNA-directed RNA polymerase specialized sigma24 family protein
LSKPGTSESTAVAGQTRWFTEEVHPHDASLKAYLRGSFPSVRDVDDVVQESYLRIWKARAIHPISSARAFLFRIARHLALDTLRHENNHARIEQYEMAFRMQTSVPELGDLSDKPPSTWELYGDGAREAGSFAYNCLIARRLAERGVRFTQVYQRGWDVHADVVGMLPELCAETDRGCFALITDLERRGLLDDTLVVWGGEFGRTVYRQGGLSRKNYGRDHHPRCFTTWMAGGGVKAGVAYGRTDDFSYNVVHDPVHVRDFNATVLHLLGIDHERLAFRHQGLDQKLTGVVPARVVNELIA